MEINIRKAEERDMQEVLNLIQELAIFEKEPNAVIISKEDLERDGFGEKPLFDCFVAEVEGNIHGMALFYFRYSTWKGKTVHLEDLVVREQFRGKGLGTALYSRVIEFAYNQNVQRTEWVVLNWNKEAASFYRKSGASILEDWDTVQMDRQNMQSYLENKNML